MVLRHNNDNPPPYRMNDLQEVFRIAREAQLPEPPWLDRSKPSPSHVLATTQRAIDIYLLSQRPNGEMGGIGWWQSANGYTTMALHDLWSSSDSKHNYTTLATAIRKCEGRQRGLINVFNDDTLWWGLLCLHMYSLNQDRWFFHAARAIWQHVRDSGSVCRKGEFVWRGRDMEGAVFWTTKKGEEQINAISTGLFAELGLRLALVVREEGCPAGQTSCEEYIEAAHCSLTWILRYRYRPREGVVLDHIRLGQDRAVDWTFTYTTAVTVGVCALLYAATGDDEHMSLACFMACKAMTHTGWVEPHGVLTERGAYGRGTHDPWKNNDAVGFKAVLIRQLGMLCDVIEATGCEVGKARKTAEMIKCFLNVNFRAQVERNGNGNGQYGPWWDGPFECPTSHAQMAVLDVMAAARLINR